METGHSRFPCFVLNTILMASPLGGRTGESNYDDESMLMMSRSWDIGVITILYWCHCLALGISSPIPPTKETVIMIDSCRGSAVYHTRLKITILLGGSKVVLWFEWEQLKLIFVRRKIMYTICGFAEVLSPQIIGFANCKSTNCHICGSSPNIKNHSSAKLRICDMRNLFADRPPLLLLKAKWCWIYTNHNSEIPSQSPIII
jgi:hypothetical protein